MHLNYMILAPFVKKKLYYFDIVKKTFCNQNAFNAIIQGLNSIRVIKKVIFL
jgi:hypothetical protein